MITNAQVARASESGEMDSLNAALLPRRTGLGDTILRMGRGAAISATALGIGVTTLPEKADASLMLNSVVGPGGSIHDSGYRALGTAFVANGDLLSFRVLVPGIGTGQRNASATMLTSEYAITSAHNIYDLLGFNPSYEVGSGDNYLTNRGSVTQIASITIFPGYNGTLQTPDIAIIQFSTPILGFNQNIIGSASPGDVLTAAGFGRSGTPMTGEFAERDGAARGWEARMWDQAPSGNISPAFYRATTFGFLNSGLSLNGAGLSGDSGGPVFNSAGELVGLLAAGTGVGQTAETSYLRLSDPVIYSWLLANTNIPTPGTSALLGLAVGAGFTRRRR